jgi:endonuclease YncB( thermonuclease family)
MRAFVTAAALAASLAAGHAYAKEEIVGRASVIDGDTIEVRGVRIRMQGIDAPESSQTCERDGQPYRCGQQAANHLDGLVGGQTVRCLEETKDKYGRTVAVCFIAGADVNAQMVEQGWAVAYRQYSTAYVPHEERAKAARKGIWAGTFQMPSEFRKAKKEGGVKPVAAKGGETPAAAEPAKKCLIKGNINAKGEKIFHVPGGRFYDNTRIEEAQGERWFCTEAEATAAGWRAAH